MTLAFQGFTVDNNLNESVNDREILNNLGGSPIGDDISLLFNNKRNVSTLNVTESNIINDTIVIPQSFSVFSNQTKITVNNLVYYVKNSNGEDSFKLSTVPDLSDTVSLPPAGMYVRSDEITFENITNYSQSRRSSDISRIDSVTQLGGINAQTTRSVILGDRTVKDIIETVESNLDFYKLKKSKSLAINSNFLGSKALPISGIGFINDIDNINENSLTEQSPGLFIYNAETNSVKRAFSSADNPWNDSDPNNLVAATSSISIGVLNFSDAIVITSKNINQPMVQSVPAQSILPLNFTHKLPIILNNETYFLCLKLET